MNLTELIFLSLGLRWTIFEYKHSYWFTFWLATVGTKKESYQRILSQQENTLTKETWLSMMKSIKADPVTIAETLGNKLRSELLECVFCQTVEVATVIWLLSMLAPEPVWMIIHSGLLILSAGYLSLVAYPFLAMCVDAVEEGFELDLTIKDEKETSDG